MVNMQDDYDQRTATSAGEVAAAWIIALLVFLAMVSVSALGPTAADLRSVMEFRAEPIDPDKLLRENWG